MKRFLQIMALAYLFDLVLIGLSGELKLASGWDWTWFFICGSVALAMGILRDWLDRG